MPTKMVTHCLDVWSQTQHPGSSYSSYFNGPLAMFPEGLQVSSETDSSHYAEPRVVERIKYEFPKHVIGRDDKESHSCVPSCFPSPHVFPMEDRMPSEV